MLDVKNSANIGKRWGTGFSAQANVNIWAFKDVPLQLVAVF